MEKKAVIIGGSLGGLMHGIMLRNNGYSVTILEQEAAVHRIGYDAGINAGPSTVKLLNEHDRIQRPYAIHTPTVQVIKRNGTEAWKMKKHMPLTSWGLLTSILRANFDGLPSKAVPTPPEIDEKLPSAVFMNGAHVRSVEEMGSKVLVRYDGVQNNGSQTSSVETDLVIGADGSNSSVRTSLVPEVSRKYSGYVSWRGTVQENLLDAHDRAKFEGKAVFHRIVPGQILCYLIPTDDGDLEPGNRVFNWVWYVLLPEDTAALRETMTDINGTVHYGTVPRQLIRPEVWQEQLKLAKSTLPSCFAALIERTKAPFVTKIYNVVSKKAVFFDGKLYLVGDALAGFRPHPGESTSQAAYHCNMLQDVIRGNMTRKQWERAALRFAYKTELWSVVLGSFGLSLRLALIRALFRYALLLARQFLGFVH